MSPMPLPTSLPPAVRFAVRTLYYLAVLSALAALHGGGETPATGFIYQAF